LKLNIAFSDFCQIVNGRTASSDHSGYVQAVYTDTRSIIPTQSLVFFALHGPFRNGHAFVSEAYAKGCRLFVIDELLPIEHYPEARFVVVKDTMQALQFLARFHRSRFSYPVVAITGSAGKTTVKEWLYHLLTPRMRVVRSPKSFNSQLGVALSLLNLTNEADIALIEAGISQPGEMDQLVDMIQPTHGVFTSFGQAHAENFSVQAEHLHEKMKCFESVAMTFYPWTMQFSPQEEKTIHGVKVRSEELTQWLTLLPWQDQASLTNAALAIQAARFFLKDDAVIHERVSSLPQLALRMETFEGINGTTIINDTYNLDLDGLKVSLEYQLRVGKGKKRIVIIGVDEQYTDRIPQIKEIVSEFSPDQLHILTDQTFDVQSIKDAAVLIKGTRKADLSALAQRFRLKKHKTYVEINLSAIRHNLSVFKQLLPEGTHLLAMVKAQSYGSGVEKVAQFLAGQGISYLGVAYADEGVELRQQGIETPIMVMNAEQEGFEDCIRYKLEPAIYSLNQLDDFIKELITQGIQQFPIHLKIETGMKRLGFEPEELQQVIETIQAQPEVRVKSIYSHLADADNRRDKRFTHLQIDRFTAACDRLTAQLDYTVIRHLLNSEGISNYTHFAFDMVRIGIGMYGLNSHPQVAKKLQPVFSWHSSVSQLKVLKKGDSVGYGRNFIAGQEKRIAIIPVGYADGFRRSLGNGKGGVFIQGVFCPTVGRVCMDMIMVDIGSLMVQEGDPVEIIGKNQPIIQFAASMDTIPYEVMTSISKRVHRVYTED
jgi:alanine racemase